MSKNNYIYSSILLLLTSNIYAQSPVQYLTGYLAAVRNDNTQSVPTVIFADNQNEAVLIQTVIPYLSDSLDLIRRKAYYITKRIGEKSADQQVRQQTVALLTKGIGDNDRGISGYNSNALKGFDKADFSQSEREALGSFINPQTPYLDQVVKLAGYIGEESYRNGLVAIATSEVDFSIRWASRLARARMGDPASIDYIMRKLRQAPINDDLVYDVVPDLIYTRQGIVFKFLEDIINSDQASCLSADPDSDDKILCGYRVMEYLAPVIEDFPVAVDEFGDVQVDDYEQALVDVRAWFTANPNYKIDSNKY